MDYNKPYVNVKIAAVDKFHGTYENELLKRCEFNILIPYNKVQKIKNSKRKLKPLLP